jgi:peptidoglycan/xylan/chitin deacetylase (PgdA/CDA1 family)
MSIHEAAKICCDRLGLLAGFHRVVNRNTLTVVMFHRVLPAGGMAGSDSDYTISGELFDQCLLFFRRHYAVIGLDQVVSALDGRTRLPMRSLLITFDDGWDDNLEFALPYLAAQALPALIFVSTDPLVEDSSWWWQEVLLAALRQGGASFETLWCALADNEEAPRDPDRVLRLLLRYGACSSASRRVALAPFVANGAVRHMLTPERLRLVAEAGISVGSHGAAHLPLTMIADPVADMERSRRVLADLLSSKADAVLSFPHGRYSPPVISAAFSAGFQALFTSDAILNMVKDGRPARIMGRIEIPAHQISDQHGRLQTQRLATWLFLRSRHHLGSLRSLSQAAHG